MPATERVEPMTSEPYVQRPTSRSELAETQLPRGDPPSSGGRRKRRAPLASNQQRLWMLDRLHGRSSVYNLPRAFEWQGPLFVPALQASLRDLLDRHDALRMHLVERGESAQVEVADELEFRAEFVDLSATPELLHERLEQEAARPFELTGERLFRAAIFRIAPARHVLFLNVHHIVCDGASIAILLSDLASLYEAHVRGLRPSLPPLPRGYLGYGERELAATQSESCRANLERLAALLRGVEPLNLPLDHARPLVFSYRGASCPFTLPPALSEGVRALARGLSTTPYAVLFAAYQLLLARYSGQRDFAVGIPVAGRTIPDEPVVGFFTRTLVVRSDFQGSPTFAELVTRVAQRRLAALAYEQVPFERLVAALDGAHDRSRTPLFQALFSLEETRPQLDPMSGERWQRLWVGNGGAKADLTLVMEHDGEQFSGELEFCTELFERRTIERMIRNFETLLTSVVEEPHRAAMQANMLHADERAELLRVNESALELPAVGGFHELIRAVAQRSPARVAVMDKHGSMSYGELDESSDAWAARLAARGVTRGDRVGVAVGRSRRVLAVNLGVLKAGAAYVPLDPSFPRERLAFMAEDAALTCIVAESASADALPEDGPRVLLAEELEQTAEPSSPPHIVSAPQDLAYIIYTSGSTGRPKGVEVLHGGVVNLLTSMARLPGVTADDRVMAVSTFSFDMCIAELYLPLVAGACTIMAPRTCAADGETLARFIDEYGATLVQATPTTFKLLVEAGLPKQRFKAIGGGEAFPGPLARALSPCCSEVWNGYGPTETTVYATFFRIDDPERPVLIGRPIANTRLYVLDAEQQPVPFGVAGELYIAGAGVSAGYRNRPDLTSARFLRDPFVPDADARMYRTGDLVRMRADGVQYVGRTDSQVKLRGFRIELGEIESVLHAHEAVEHGVVVVRELGPGDQRLVAYLTLKQGRHPTNAELRAHLSAELPSYMVPKLLVRLTTMPMTASGKVDVSLLPDPRTEAPEEDSSRAPPRSSTERALLQIWRRLLATGELGVDDDFFAAGGHSLLAVQLVREINRVFHTHVSLGVIFEAPTIAQQAVRIDSGDHGGGVSVVLLHPGGHKEPLFCICGINLYQSLANEVGAERPVYGLYLPIEGELFEQSGVELDPRDMARQYLTAIRAVQPSGPYHLLGVSFGGALAYEIACQLRAAGQQVGLLTLLDTILPSSVSASRVRQAAKGAVRWARSHLGPLAKALETTPWSAPGARALPKLALENASEGDGEEDGAALTERMRRYQQALFAYERAIPPYEGKVVLVRALEQLKALRGCAPDYGWSRHVRGPLEIWDLPTDHLGMLRPPHVQTLARAIASGGLRTPRTEKIQAQVSSSPP